MTKLNFNSLVAFGLLFTSQAFAYKGMDSCAYGTKGCNSCVNDVPGSFQNIGDDSHSRHKFFVNPKGKGLNSFKQHPWRFLKDHVQTVARIPGLGDENWLAFSRSAEKMGDAGFFLAHFQDIKSDGRAWKFAERRKSDTSNQFYFYPISTANHAGGIQALGSLLFMANECSGVPCNGQVDIHDVSNPSKPNLITTLQVATEDEAINHRLGPLSSKGSSVAAVQLDNGHHLVYVGGRFSGKYGWFYVNKEAELSPKTTWKFLNIFHSEDYPKLPWGEWETSAFITECGSKDIYYVGMGERKSRANLYKVVENEGQLSFQHMISRSFDGSLFNTFRMGGGIHVTSDKKLIMYNSTRFGKRINEFREKK